MSEEKDYEQVLRSVMLRFALPGRSEVALLSYGFVGERLELFMYASPEIT